MVYCFNGQVINTYYCWEPQLPGQKHSVYFSFILTLKIRCNELQPRLESSPSTETPQAVFAQHVQETSQRHVCTDSYKQGWAHPQTRIIHTLCCPYQSPQIELSGGRTSRTKWTSTWPMPSCRCLVQSTRSFPKLCCSEHKCLVPGVTAEPEHNKRDQRKCKSNPMPVLHHMGRAQFRNNMGNFCSDPTKLLLLSLTGE